MPPIALQLYTVREQLAHTFEKTIRHIGAVGYVGVELAGVYGESPQAAARLFQELGLIVTSAHASLPLPERLTEAIEIATTFGTKRIVWPWTAPERFQSLAAIRAVCEELNRANAAVRQAGLELHYHNHWQECGLVEGKLVYQHMLDLLDTTIGFEVDVYWATTAGIDPAVMVRELGARAPLLHIKDGPATRDGAMTAVGQGVVNFQAIADASRSAAEWWIVELDRCDGDMLTAVDSSYAYLTQNGLAHGR